MPGMSGVDLQSHLIAQGRRIPMIFITAFRQEGTEARAMAAGAICFLTKPFDGGKLISCLTEALKGGRSVGLGAATIGPVIAPRQPGWRVLQRR